MARMTIEIPDSVRDRMEAVRVSSESSSITEAVRRSISMADSVFPHVAKGGKIILRDADGTERELVVR